jgi:hypothetical protein
MLKSADTRILEIYVPNMILSNEGVEDDHTIYLPPPFTGRQYQVLQISGYEIVLHTNANDTHFLTAKPATKLRIQGSPETIGKCLTIDSYHGMWRVSASTFNDSQLIFEE